MREYDKEKGNYTFIFGNENGQIRITLNAGKPDPVKWAVNENLLYKGLCSGVAGSTLTIEGISNNKKSICKLSWSSVVHAIFTRCKLSRKLLKYKSERIGKVPLSMDKEKGKIYFSLPCAKSDKAGIEIILTCPQGLEIFVNDECTLSCVPSVKPNLVHDKAKIAFRTWNTDKLDTPFIEIGLTEFISNFAKVKIDKVENETDFSYIKHSNGKIDTSRPIRLSFGQCVSNSRTDKIGALWHFYTPHLWCPVSYEIPHLKDNYKARWKSNHMFGWIFYRSFGHGMTTQK